MGKWIAVFLQAAGVLLLIWAALGLLLRGFDRGGAIVCPCRQVPESFIRYYAYLVGAGLTRMPLILLDCGLDEGEKERLKRMARGLPITLCNEEDLGKRLRTEDAHDGGFGTAAG